MRRAAIIAGVLFLGISLTACEKHAGQDILKEQPEDPQITAAVAAKPQVTISAEQAKQKNAGQDAGNNTGSTAGASEPDGSDKSKLSDSAGEADMEKDGQGMSKEFYYEELSDEIIDRITGKSYGSSCTVPYAELRYVRVLYCGFDHETHRGELIVNKAIAEDIVEIFKELYTAKYPIERMVLVDDYDADDNTSMAADNTSAFNYRNVDGTKHLSLHSYGLAVDINPLYNPYVRTINQKTVILPENGSKYADRALDCSYYIHKEDPCCKAFIEHGFTWGGSWKDSKDYQHFQKESYGSLPH